MLQTYSIKLLRMLLCHRCFLRTCTQGTHNKLCCCWLCFLVGMPLVQKVYSKASHVLIDIHTARNMACSQMRRNAMQISTGHSKTEIEV